SFRISLKIDFTDPNVPYHDISLMIDGDKIYVSKQILAAASPVFRSMFYSEFAEKNKNEVKLKDVDKNEFIEFLHVIYPQNWNLTDSSVEGILKLSDRFQVKGVIERVEDFLIDSE
ncbi:hypothetical protein PMAYCL1PPCAC_25235, partial [Pristionchus mayeri]